MQTLVILVGAAGAAAAVVWWASVPATPRAHAPTVPGRSPGRPRLRRPRRRPFILPTPTSAASAVAPVPSPSPTSADEALVLERSTIPDERPNLALALLRLVFTIALVAALGVAILAGLWLVVNGQLAGYLAR